MKNGIENGYYHEITPQGFGLVIKAKEVLFKQKLLDNCVENEGKLLMYDHFENPSLINETLVKNGLKVSSLSFSNNGFEDYFIERLGK